MAPSRHSRTFKIGIIWALALGVLAVLLLAVQGNRQLRVQTQPTLPSTMQVSSTQSLPADIQAEATLTNAVYQGTDTTGQTWQVQAGHVVQHTTLNHTQIQLTSVTAQWALPTQAHVTLSAGGGLLNQTSQTLVLQNTVSTTWAGFTLTMPQALVNLAQRSVTSQQAPVILTGNTGSHHIHLTGQSLSTTSGATRIRLTGKVRAVLTESPRP